MGPELESVLLNAHELLAEKMASEDACAEVLSAMGHVDAALRDLMVRDERLAHEQERARIEQEMIDTGAYGSETERMAAAQAALDAADLNSREAFEAAEAAQQIEAES